MKKFVTLNKLKAGDQVAVISPSCGLPEIFPHVFDLGLKRLRDEFGLQPKEYPTTRRMNSSLQDRAGDIMAAFSDPANKAVFSSIGGDDQLDLLKFLDKQLLIQNPKPFFGYSDATNLHIFLWSLGIPSYYGAALMTQFANNQAMDEHTKRYIRAALFEDSKQEIVPSEYFSDEELSWADPSNLDRQRKREGNEGWFWDGSRDARGILFGGCLEIFAYQLMIGRWLPTARELKNCILCLETSEDLPDHYFVRWVLRALGERGALANFSGFLIGRPKSWSLTKPLVPAAKIKYREDQRAIMLSTIREYNREAPVVLNVEFGHTEPQVPLPLGRMAKIDPQKRKLIVQF